MAKNDYIDIPIQFTRFNKEEPYSRDLPLLVELAENIYQLLSHPVFGRWRDYAAIDHFKVPLSEGNKFHRTYFERTIYQAKAMGNPEIGGKVLTMTSEGFEHSIESVQMIWQVANNMVYGEGYLNNGFDFGVYHFRLTSASHVMVAAIYFANTLNEMMFAHQENQCKLELGKITVPEERTKWLFRMQANIEQRRDQLDNIIYDGLMKWTGIELQFLKNISAIDEVSQEIKAIIESYLAEKKTRTSNLQLLQYLIDDRLDEFCDGLSALVMNVFSYMDFAANDAEKIYHVMLAGLLNNFSTEYKLSSNRESGLGRYDLMLTPNHLGNAGLIIEIKNMKTDAADKKDEALNTALMQIKNKKYFHELKQLGHSKGIAIAAVFSNKQLYFKHAVLDF